MLYRYGNQWLQWNGHPSLQGLGASIFGGGAPVATFHGGSLTPSSPLITPPPAAPAPAPSATAITGGGGTTFSSGPQGAALPDSAALPAGFVTWIAQSATHNPGEFSAFITGVDPYDLDIQGAHGAGGFGHELRIAVLPWGSTSLRTVSDLRSLLRSASTASGNSFAGDLVYPGDIVSGGVSTPTISTAPPTPILATTGTPSLPSATGRTSSGRGTTPTTPAPPANPTIIGPTTPAPAAGAGAFVSMAQPTNQTCIPVFNHEGAEFSCLPDHSQLPQGYQAAMTTLPNGSGFTAGVLPIFWLEIATSAAGVPYLRLNDFQGTVVQLTGPHVPDLRAPAPAPTIIPGPALNIPRTIINPVTRPAQPAECPTGTHRNVFTGACDPDAGTPPPGPGACPTGYVYDATSGACVPAPGATPTGCPQGQFLQDDGNCYPSGHCPPGESWQAIGATNSIPPSILYGCGPASTTPTCPQGQAFDSTIGCYTPGLTPPPTPSPSPTPTPGACITYYNHEGASFDCQPSCNSSYPLSQVTTPSGNIVQACLLPGFHLAIQNGQAVIVPPAPASGTPPSGTIPIGTTPGDGTTTPTAPAGGNFLDSLAASTGLSKSTLTWIAIGAGGLLLFGKR